MEKVKGVNKRIEQVKESVILAVVSVGDYQKINIELVKHLTKEEKISSVYVTLNKPFEVMKSLLEKKGIDTEKIVFIDAITKISKSKSKAKNCLFVGSPENISDISIAVEQAVKLLPGKKKFLFFDSLSTLLLYNNIETVARFIHFLRGKMKDWKVKRVIIALEREKDRELIDKLSEFCEIIGREIDDVLVKKTGWKLFVTPVHKKILPVIIPSGILGFVFYIMVQIFIEKVPVNSFKAKFFLISVIFLYVLFVMLFFLLSCLVYTFVDYHQKKE